jgi:ABC-2 type transport system ATP-binding protein
MPELVPLYPELRVREHLGFRAAIKGVARRRVDAEVLRVAEACGLLARIDATIGTLSRGYRQRVGIADALLGAPPLVVLDEPTVGLDPNQIREIRDMLRALGGAQTLVFSSHILAEVESLCDRVVILAHGKVVLDATLADALGTAHLDVEVACGVEDATRTVRAALASVDLADARVDATPREGATAVRIELPRGDREAVDRLRMAVGEAALAASVAVTGLVPGRTRLETRFAEVTGGQRDGA